MSNDVRGHNEGGNKRPSLNPARTLHEDSSSVQYRMLAQAQCPDTLLARLVNLVPYLAT